MIGKVVDRQEAVKAGGGDLAAADAGEAQWRGGALSEGPHQRGAEPVIGFFRRDRKISNSPDALSGCPDVAAVVGSSHRY